MKFLTRAQVIEQTSLSKTALYVQIKQGNFPKPVLISAKRKAWLQSDIEQWIQERVKKSRSSNEV